MTDNEVKEIFSDCFIKLVLARERFKVYESKYDHGVDLLVGPVDKTLLPNGETMFEDSDRRIDVRQENMQKKKMVILNMI